jgi:hypothetical protein
VVSAAGEAAVLVDLVVAALAGVAPEEAGSSSEFCFF